MLEESVLTTPPLVAEAKPTTADITPALSSRRVELHFWNEKIPVTLTPPSDIDIQTEAHDEMISYCSKILADDPPDETKAFAERSAPTYAETLKRNLAYNLSDADNLAKNMAEGFQLGAATVISVNNLKYLEEEWEEGKLWAGKETTPVVQVLRAFSTAAAGNRNWRQPDAVIRLSSDERTLLYKTGIEIAEATGLAAFQNVYSVLEKKDLAGEKAHLYVVVQTKPNTEGGTDISAVGFSPAVVRDEQPDLVYCPNLHPMPGIRILSISQTTFSSGIKKGNRHNFWIICVLITLYF